MNDKWVVCNGRKECPDGDYCYHAKPHPIVKYIYYTGKACTNDAPCGKLTVRCVPVKEIK